MNKWKTFLLKQNDNQTIKKDNLIIIILAGILLLVICIPVNSTKGTANSGNSTGKMEEEIQNENKVISDNEETQMEEYTRILEEKLESALTYMDGVGKVKVMITLKSSKEQIVEKDIPNSRSSITESDAQGGTRNSNEMDNSEETVYQTNQEGEKTPYVIKEVQPSIEGVIVVAQGGRSAECCKNITEVIQALFGLEAHKIKVVKMKTN